MTISRRDLVDRALRSSLLLLTFQVSGTHMLLTPRQARAQGLPLRQLSERQARQIEVLADRFVPGAAAAGIVQFVDHQLNVDPNESLLIAKYFQVVPPYAGFYARGLSVADAVASRQTAGELLTDLEGSKLDAVIREIANPQAVVDEFPLGLFYLCLRSDAVDVVYGTPEGFARLGVPYMEHILPPEGWNA